MKGFYHGFTPAVCLIVSSLFPFVCLDGDPQETRQQELGGLHGAVQGEQIPECEERLRHHPLLSGDEFTLSGQDDHPQGQTEHGQRLDAALGKKKSIRAVQHLPLSQTAVFIVISATVVCIYTHIHTHTHLAPPFTPWVNNVKDAGQETSPVTSVLLPTGLLDLWMD